MAKKGKYIYDWPRPMVTVDAVVFRFFANKAKLLLIERKNEPFKGKWALPGGFVDIDEELEDAVVRELAEETGLTGVKLEQMYTFGKCGRDPRGRMITIAFMGVVRSSPRKKAPTEGQTRTKAGDDAENVRWFDLESLPADMAFDHREMATFAIGRLKRKKIYRLKSRALKKPTVKKH